MGINKEQLFLSVEKTKSYIDDKVKPVTDTINRLATKKFTNSTTDYCFICDDDRVSSQHTLSKEMNILSCFRKMIGNMIRTEDDYICLKKGKTYMVNASIFMMGGKVPYYLCDREGNAYNTWGYTSSSDSDVYNDSHLRVCLSNLEKDLDVCVKVYGDHPNAKLFENYSWFSVEEIGSKIELDPLNYVNEESGIEDCPVGHIMAMMGTSAPKHYLVCDGAIYNIIDYPHLAEHFRKDFGTVNHFGGDGVETFAIPDLRNEFLRGYHGEAEQLSGEVGAHQEPTSHPEIRSLANGGMQTFLGDKTVTSTNRDTFVTTKKYANGTGQVVNGSTDFPMSYTSRPTNVAVLYCIKYEPTYYMNVVSYGYEKETVFDGKLVVGDHEIPSLEKYDFVQVYGILSVDDASNNHNHKSSLIIHKDDILKTDTTLVGAAFILCASPGTGTTANRRIGFGFSDYMHINIGDISGGGYICTIYGYKRKNHIEKADNRETQSVIIEGLTSTTAANTYFDYPKGYNSTNSIIRSLNILAESGWVIPHQLTNYIQLQADRICVNLGSDSWYGRKVQFELAKKSSVVYHAKDPLENKKIMLCGDSIIFGTGWEGGWGNIISENHDCTVLNCAAAGSCLSDGHIHYLLDEGLKQMPEPDYLILDGGGNDMFRGNDFGTFERYVYPTDYDSINKTTALGYLEAIFFILRNTLPRTKVIFVIPYPILTEDASYQVQDEKYELLRNLCKKYCVPVVDYFIISNLVPNNGVQHEAFMYDWLHINEAGYRHLYPQLEKELMNL